ncbi:ABC transporter substrate-binding protein [Roseovarius aestuarii]|nr:ABC transporter substrate-binding protein [Roseovarius aestuarii]
MKWMTDRRRFMQLGGAALAGAMARPQFAWAVEGSTLRLRVGGDFQVLDPFGIIGELDDIIPRCTQVTLVRLGDAREGSELSLWGAEKMEWTSPTTLAFTLREGLNWTGDYGPVTAEDVKFSFERIAGSESAWAYQFDYLDHVEVIDERNGIIHLNAAYPPFDLIALPYYAGHIQCKAAVEAVGGSYTTEIPAQCGPYLFDNWEQNRKVTLKANPDWTGPKPDFDTIEFYIVADDQTALLAYEADAYDFTSLAPNSLRQVKSSMPSGATLIEAPSTRYTWLTINMNAEPLKDPRVRQAIQLAYDGEAVLQGAFDGAVPRATGVVAPGPYSRPSNIYAKRDVERARALLAEAGAENLRLSLISQSDSTSLTIAQIIQATLGEAGISVDIQPTESAAYWAAGDKTQGDGYKSIELVLMNFAGGLEPTENLVWFMPDQIGVYNWSFFDNSEFADLYAKASLEPDTEKRKAMFHRMEDLMEESGGFIFIAFEPYIAIHDENLRPSILADGHPDPVMFRKI